MKRNLIEVLLKQIADYKRKYYFNQMIKGALITLAILLALYLLLVVSEHYNYFSPKARFILVISFFAAALSVIIPMIVVPWFKLQNILKNMDDEEAAKQIGLFFQEIDDKLLNTLQLSAQNPENHPLIEATLKQRTEKLSYYNFGKAINYRINHKYIKFIIIPALILLVIFVSKPEIITQSTQRLVHYDKVFEKPAPFEIIFNNKDLTIFQNEDFTIDISIKGTELPSELFLHTSSGRFSMKKLAKTRFVYTIKNVQKTDKIYFTTQDYNSKTFVLSVIPKPQVLDFRIEIEPPLYTQKEKTVVVNTGDIQAPKGSQIKWNFKTRNAKSINFIIDAKILEKIWKTNSMSMADNAKITLEEKKFLKEALQVANNGDVSKKLQVFQSGNYFISPSNEMVKAFDTLVFNIDIIEDSYPTINVETFKDSVLNTQLFFKGEINDDYGFSRLNFVYKINNKSDKEEKTVLPVEIQKNIIKQNFYYVFDLQTDNLKPGAEVEYYFEVWDNDAINGSKSIRSQSFLFRKPTIEELEKESEKRDQQIKEELEKSLKESKKINNEIEKLHKSLLENKEISFQEKNKLQELINRQQEIINRTKEIQKQHELKLKQEATFKEQSEQLLKKQEQLEKLFKELLNPELLDLLRKIEEMMKMADKEKMKEAMDKLKLSNKDLEKQIDRNLELFKQLEFQQKMEETISKLNELQQKQENLAKETENNKEKEIPQSIKNQQDQINQMFEQLREDIKELRKKNEELEFPNPMRETQNQEEKILQELNKSKEALKNNKSNKASQSQKNASEEMKNLSEELEKIADEMDQDAEDAEKLREILENLVKTSFAQEALMQKVQKTSITDPMYVKNVEQQKKIKDDLKMIEDTLFALSKRQVQIESIVNQEIASINQNMEQAIEFFHKRNTSFAVSKQQFIMTSINNLALLLAESLKEMKNDLNMKSQSKCNNKSSCKKGGSCSKPGDGKPSFKKLRELQEKLNKEMQDALNGKPREGKNGMMGLSEQMARMAAEQEAIRNKLQELQDALKQQGMGNSKEIDKMLQEMEKTETELVNKMLNESTIKRQQEILSRLLESEKAEQIREMDEKRESNEAKNYNFSNPNQFLEYKRIIEREKELLKNKPLQLKPYYKEKVNQYFFNVVE